MRRRFVVKGTIEIKVDFEEALMPDDEWRSVFYSIYTIEELAEHLAWNLGINKWSLSSLDGFADRPDKDAVLLDVDVEFLEVEEIKECVSPFKV